MCDTSCRQLSPAAALRGSWTWQERWRQLASWGRGSCGRHGRRVVPASCRAKLPADRSNYHIFLAMGENLLVFNYTPMSNIYKIPYSYKISKKIFFIMPFPFLSYFPFPSACLSCEQHKIIRGDLHPLDWPRKENVEINLVTSHQIRNHKFVRLCLQRPTALFRDIPINPPQPETNSSEIQD